MNNSICCDDGHATRVERPEHRRATHNRQVEGAKVHRSWPPWMPTAIALWDYGKARQTLVGTDWKSSLYVNGNPTPIRRPNGMTPSLRSNWLFHSNAT
eukprot:9503851-Pyramimonas_sp.AAC.9